MITTAMVAVSTLAIGITMNSAYRCYKAEKSEVFVSNPLKEMHISEENRIYYQKCHAEKQAEAKRIHIISLRCKAIMEQYNNDALTIEEYAPIIIQECFDKLGYQMDMVTFTDLAREIKADRDHTQRIASNEIKRIKLRSQLNEMRFV